MNSVNFKTENNYISLFCKSFLFTFFYFVHFSIQAGDWSVDLSRRQVDFDRIENSRMPATAVTPMKKSDEELLSAVKKIVNPIDISQDIVILQTESGFIPETIQLKKDVTYKLHVVNLNKKEKNVSFMMDAFSQTHSTVYGQVKSFVVHPKIDGVFSYQSPETGFEGKAVVITDAKRKVASKEKN